MTSSLSSAWSVCVLNHYNKNKLKPKLEPINSAHLWIAVLMPQLWVPVTSPTIHKSGPDSFCRARQRTLSCFAQCEFRISSWDTWQRDKRYPSWNILPLLLHVPLQSRGGIPAFAAARGTLALTQSQGLGVRQTTSRADAMQWPGRDGLLLAGSQCSCSLLLMGSQAGLENYTWKTWKTNSC